MLTPRRSGNRDTGNLPAAPASMVKPLIPLSRTPAIARKSSGGSHLPCVVFLEVGRWVETPVDPYGLKKATSDPN
jgi:hypothetical protein